MHIGAIRAAVHFGDTFGIIYGVTADGFNQRELRDHVLGVLVVVPDVHFLAELVVFLATVESNFITGQDFKVDGFQWVI